MEIDITAKVRKIIGFSFPILLCVALLSASGMWFYQVNNKHISLCDAKVNGKMVQARCRAEGTVVEIKVEDGSSVKAGQKLAGITVKITEEQLQQLRQNVILAEENLARLREGVVVNRPVYHASGVNDAASEKLARMEELYRLGAISAAERDAAAAAAGSPSGGEVSYETIVQPSSPEALQNGERRLQQARAALERVSSSSQATEVTAPVTGTVFLQDLKVGKEVKSGEVLALIGSAEDLWIEAMVSESQSQQIFVGQVAKCKVNGRWLEGSVTDVTSLLRAKDGQGDMLTKEDGKLKVVYVSVPLEKGESLRPGQTAELVLSLL